MDDLLAALLPYDFSWCVFYHVHSPQTSRSACGAAQWQQRHDVPDGVRQEGGHCLVLVEGAVRDVGEWRRVAISDQLPSPILQGNGRDAVGYSQAHEDCVTQSGRPTICKLWVNPSAWSFTPCSTPRCGRRRPSLAARAGLWHYTNRRQK